jgi:hypothetical protein
MNEQYYFGYLGSPEWKAKRKAVKKRCSNICERCHLYLVDEVHHLTYERLHNESLEDLQGLCCGCHDFLHGKTGIDPIEKSIRVTVSEKIIEFWDAQAEKLRRVHIAKLPPEKSRWFRMCAGEQFAVPEQVFLDEQGKAILDPSGWERYRVSSMRAPRRLPPDFESEFAEQKKRMELEEKRLKENPECYTSFRNAPPETAKEAKALFKKYLMIVERGRECTIRNVRETKSWGVVLDLQERTTSGWSRYQIHEAHRKLAEGEIVLDHDRKVWVVMGEA